MYLTDICICVNYEEDLSLEIKATKNNFKKNKDNILDCILKKIIKYNFKKIYLLCFEKKKFFFKKYNKKKIHNSLIICIEANKNLSLSRNFVKLEKYIHNNFIFIKGSKLSDINLNDLKSYKIKNNIIGMFLNSNKKKPIKRKIIKLNNINVKNYLKKNNLESIETYFISKKIFNFLKKIQIYTFRDLIDKLIKKEKIIFRIFNAKIINFNRLFERKIFKQKKFFFKNKAIFLDIDGVINRLIGYVLDYKDFSFLPGTAKGIKYANDKNYLVIVITNQSAVGRSWLSEAKLRNIHKRMRNDLFKFNGALIDDIYYSPYFKDSKYKKFRIKKKDRKPNNGMLLKAIKKWNIDIHSSVFIGDQITDKYAAELTDIKFHFKKNNSLYKQLKSII